MNTVCRVLVPTLMYAALLAAAVFGFLYWAERRERR